MFYYEIIPASNIYHGKEPLTYSSGKKLGAGQLAVVPLRHKSCLGIVVESVKKPDFATSGIEKALDITLPPASLELLSWLDSFYPGRLGAAAQMFAPAFVQKIEAKPRSAKLPGPQLKSLPDLTPEQTEAYKQISADKHKSYIVHGVTGSGKTRLYIELAKDNIKKGKSVVVLTPEISLTAPIARSFQQVFGERVKISHSSLTPKQRQTLWQEAYLSKQPLIVIGPRSTLFLPLKSIGLIVVDEFHEPAYKQESSPFYHANRVASKLAELAKAKVIFGSATPPVNDYYLALKKNIPIIRLKYPAITQQAPRTSYEIVDLLDKNENSGQPLLSKTLIKHIGRTLAGNEQAMLFINKRGSARSISCQDCGHRELCPRCDLPMVYHADEHNVRCHTCGYKKTPPNKCPKCSSMNIYFSSPGTKAITARLQKLFPKAKIGRFDRDNKKAERMENTYDTVVDGLDIIVGTQLIAKGHDLPRLSLVAMLLAENGLDFPDFSSQERSYQLMKQLSGRINRGHRDGLFVVQTFNKSGQLLQSLQQESWDDFFTSEIAQRRKHGFPPFYSALKIESARSSRKSAEQSLEKLKQQLSHKYGEVEFLGPSPSFLEKKAAKWHWQLLVKSRNRMKLAELAKEVPTAFRADIDPANFL